MSSHLPRVVVAGHLCLDIIPGFVHTSAPDEPVIMPGHLVHVGPSVLATGGAVSNTGQALHRLGVPTRLVGMIGEDLFGEAILQILRRHDPALATDIIVHPETASSYTIVISPPGLDRSFLHCPGANDVFSAGDITSGMLRDAALLHFGYPPLMRRMYVDDGDELCSIFQRAHATGLVTSLDLAHVDPNSTAGRVDWRNLLANVLPHVDILTPNLDEVFSMLAPQEYKQRQSNVSHDDPVASGQLADLSDQLLDMGVSLLLIKLGEHGVYFRSTKQTQISSQLGTLELANGWWERELLAPAFEVEVAGTTGAGDCTVAGFLAALLRSLSPPTVLTIAAAVGAANVEHPDAITGVPSWPDLQHRLHSNWPRRPQPWALSSWHWNAEHVLWHSARDKGA